VDLTLAAAIFAGVVSFLSPCVLPVLPAYLGQMGVVAAAAYTMPTGTTPTGDGTTAILPPRATSRWHVLPHALAFVAGFALIFTILGLTFYAFRPLFELPPVRIAGGILVIILGLNLMGVLRIGILNRSWAPASATQFGQPAVGGASAKNPLAALALGAVFALAMTPCIGPTLGAILGLSLTAGAAPQVVALLLAYSLGIGIPFLILALAMDGSARFVRPFLKHGRTIELIGGGLVVIIGIFIVFDWLGVIAKAFQSLWPQV
jgi:cytochrome c-type biogenesis protein